MGNNDNLSVGQRVAYSSASSVVVRAGVVVRVLDRGNFNRYEIRTSYGRVIERLESEILSID